MLRLEQMTDGITVVYRMEYIENGITITKYFQEVDNGIHLDETKLRSVDNGFYVEIQ